MDDTTQYVMHQLMDQNVVQCNGSCLMHSHSEQAVQLVSSSLSHLHHHHQRGLLLQKSSQRIMMKVDQRELLEPTVEHRRLCLHLKRILSLLLLSLRKLIVQYVLLQSSQRYQPTVRIRFDVITVLVFLSPSSLLRNS